MEKDLPPPYPGPSVPIQGAPPLANPALPTYSPGAFQPEVTVMQPSTIIQPQPAVVMVKPVVIQPAIGEVPARLRCTFCQQEIVTATRPINGLLTWTVFGVLLVLLIWPCCLIPFCVSSCQDVEHSCPSCKNILHIHRRM